MKTLLFLLGALVSTVSVAGDEELLGQWRGQAQYQITNAQVLDPNAHAVVGLTLAIESQYRVTGISPENGCRFLGIATPRVAGIFDLDLTLSGCRYQAFNRRMAGRLTLHKPDNRVTLNLEDRTIVHPISVFEIKGNLMR